MRDTKIYIDESDSRQFYQAAQENPSHNFKLSVVQQPLTGKAVSTNLRCMKWPIEPPPVLELTSGEKEPQKWLYIHNPNWFCVADLISIESTKKQNARKDNSKEGSKDNLSGLLASSLHKVKNPDDRNEHGYFVFGDLNVRDPGRYKLEFTLFEMRRYEAQVYAAKVDSIMSNEFEVSNRTNLPSKDSTKLSKTLSESGVKIRLRKESTKRKQTNFNWSSTTNENFNYGAAGRGHPHPVTLAPLVNVPMMAPPPSNPTGRLARNSGEDIARRLTVVQTDMNAAPSSQALATSPYEIQAQGGNHSYNTTGGQHTAQYEYDLQHTLSPGSKLPQTFPPMPHPAQLPYQSMQPQSHSQQPWTFTGQGTFRPDSSLYGPPGPRTNHEREDSGYSSHGRPSLTHMGTSGMDAFTRPQQYNPTSMPAMHLPPTEPLQPQQWHINAAPQGYNAYETVGTERQPEMAQHSGAIGYMFQSGTGQAVYGHQYPQTSQS